MRITVLTSSYPRFPGDGAAPFVKSLAENMVKLGHDVQVVAPYDPKVSFSDDNGVRTHRFRYVIPERFHIMGHAQAMEADVRVRKLSYLLLPLFLLSAIINLLRIAISSRADIIHVHWVLPNGPAALFVSYLLNKPYVLSLHGSDVFVAKKYKAFSWIARWVFKRASQITACSQDLMDNAISLGAPADRIHLIPWGADPEIFKPNRRSEDYLSQWGLKSDDFIVCALGRFVYKKGFDKLIEAWKIISSQVQNARLLIGGDGPLRDELVSKAQEMGLSQSVIFPGSIDWDHVPEFISSSGIFVLPSVEDRYGNIDGLPTVLLEAMACGTPVIASNLGGIPLVIDDGQNGKLVPPGDVQTLAQTILELIRDEKLRTAISHRARKDVVDQFNWSNVSKIFIDLFEKSIHQQNSSTRMGSIYRDEMMQLLNLRKSGDKVLDVGCYDGLFLKDIPFDIKIGVDPEPIRRFSNINLIKADGCHLPFADHSFEYIYSLDVIEHIQDDRMYAESLLRVLYPTGLLVITTPNKEIQVFPSFLQNWVNRRWQHHLRSGYSVDELVNLFKSEGVYLKISEWNAPAYRLLYFPVRFLFSIFPGLTKNLIKKLARWDYRHQKGNRGFLIMEARRMAES